MVKPVAPVCYGYMEVQVTVEALLQVPHEPNVACDRGSCQATVPGTHVCIRVNMPAFVVCM